MTTAQNTLHHDTLERVSYYLSRHIRVARLGHFYTAPMYVELAPGTIVRPDIFVTLHAEHERAAETETHIIGTPDLIVEVITPAIAAADWQSRQDTYARAGVTECWMVQPAAKAVQVLVLEDGKYRSPGVFEGQAILHSHVIPLFALPVEKFFA